MNNPLLHPDRLSRPQVVLSTRAIIKDTSGQILLIKRADNDSSNPLKWEFPGGKLDEGQNVQASLQREVLEETGISLNRLSEIVHCDSKLITSGKYSGFPYISLTWFAEVEIHDKIELSEEHSDFIWTTQDEALNYDLVKETRKALIALSNKI